MSIVVKDGNGTSQTIQTLPSVGPAAGAASLPVVLATDSNHATSANITSLSAAITGALAPQGGLPVALSGTVAVTQSGTWTVGLATGATVALAGGNTVALKVDGSAATQPVSASALPLPAGAATSALQATGNTSLTAISTVNGAPTDTAWDGAAASVTQTGLLKAIWIKLAARLFVDTVVQATAVDRSSTITTGGTAQQLMAANASRRGYWVQNLSSGDLWVNGLGTAAAGAPSMKIPAGALYETPPHHSGTNALSIYGATTAQAFSAREF